MPQKIRELKEQLLQAGFSWRKGKGSHTVWYHAKLIKPLCCQVMMAKMQNHIKKKMYVMLSQKQNNEKAMSKYTMTLQWSEEDSVFVVSLPEFPHCQTHGETYLEAVQQGQEMIESLMDFYEQEQKPLPVPQVFSASSLKTA